MKTLTLNYYTDPGHGWVKVKLDLLKSLDLLNQISNYSYYRNEYAYLEEDCDLAKLYQALNSKNITLKLKEHICRSKRSKIRSYDSFYRINQTFALINKAAA